MTCHDCHELLQRCLDGETIADPGLDAHLAACAECRAWQAAARRLEAGIGLLPRTVPPPGLSNRIVAAVVRERRWAWRRRTIRVAAALAAVIILAVMIGSWAKRYNPPTGVPDEQPMVEKRIPEPGPPPAPANSPSLRQSMTDVAQLTLRRADETMRTLVPAPSANQVAPSPLDSSVASLREAGNGVSAGLEPVADSARRAWNLLRRELPPAREAQQ